MDEKPQMHMQDHWACPNNNVSIHNGKSFLSIASCALYQLQTNRWFLPGKQTFQKMGTLVRRKGHDPKIIQQGNPKSMLPFTPFCQHPSNSQQDRCGHADECGAADELAMREREIIVSIIILAVVYGS